MDKELVRQFKDKKGNIVLVGNHMKAVGIFLPDEKSEVIQDFCRCHNFKIVGK